MPRPLYVFILRPIVYVIHFVIVSVVRANSINVDLTLMYNYRFATSVTNVTNVVVKRFLFSFSLHNIYYPKLFCIRYTFDIHAVYTADPVSFRRVRAMNALAGKRQSLGNNSPTISHLSVTPTTSPSTTPHNRLYDVLHPFPTYTPHAYTRPPVALCDVPLYAIPTRLYTAHKPPTPTPSPSHIHAHYIEVIRLYIGRWANVSRYSIVYHTDISTAYYRYIAIATQQ